MSNAEFFDNDPERVSTREKVQENRLTLCLTLVCADCVGPGGGVPARRWGHCHPRCDQLRALETVHEDAVALLVCFSLSRQKIYERLKPLHETIDTVWIESIVTVRQHAIPFLEVSLVRRRTSPRRTSSTSPRRLTMQAWLRNRPSPTSAPDSPTTCRTTFRSTSRRTATRASSRYLERIET